jgi:hypothetical protein
MRILRQIFQIGVLGALAAQLGSPASGARAGAVEHLYVAQVDRTTQQGVVERFPLRSGRLSHTPDLSYSGFTGPIAVDPADNVYIAKSFAPSRTQEIDVFASGSTTPSRRLLVTYSNALVSTTALTVDRAGFLYVAFSARTSGGVTYIANVYAPGARGHATPVAGITSAFQEPFSALALDDAGRLYASFSTFPSNPQGGIAVYSNPHSSPTAVQVLSSPYIDGVTGIAIAAGEVYVLSASFQLGGGPRGFVLAFHVSAGGGVHLDRKITVQNQVALRGGIALDGGRLFVPEAGSTSNPPVAPAVYELDASGDGTQIPIDTLTVPASDYVLDAKVD